MPETDALNSSLQTLVGTDIESVMMLGLAALFAGFRFRGDERGFGWLAAGFCVAGLWYFYSKYLDFSGHVLSSRVVQFAFMVLGGWTISINIGIAHYLGKMSAREAALVAVWFAPALLLFIALGLGLEVPRRVFQIGTLLSYVGTAGLALARRAKEPHAGHGLLAVVLLTLPLIPLIALALGIPPSQIGTVAGLPPVLFGMVLLTISLRRRRVALEEEVARRVAAELLLRDTNRKLELRVAERTANLQELVAGLEAFNRSVSHDLRGPLSGIADLARLAHDALVKGSPELALRSLPVIAKQAGISTRLVTTLLELARVGSSPLSCGRTRLGDLVQEAFDTVRLTVKGPLPMLSCGELPEVITDADLLRPVLANLIGNAVKFSRGIAKARVVVEARAEGGMVVVRVSDNGIGFSGSDTGKLFEPFVRLHGADFEGHGLGLSIARRAVERLGGRVWVTPNPDSGLSFHFSTPQVATDEAPTADLVASGRQTPRQESVLSSMQS
jgi:signal transduction histidine kinase